MQNLKVKQNSFLGLTGCIVFQLELLSFSPTWFIHYSLSFTVSAFQMWLRRLLQMRNSVDTKTIFTFPPHRLCLNLQFLAFSSSFIQTLCFSPPPPRVSLHSSAAFHCLRDEGSSLLRLLPLLKKISVILHFNSVIPSLSLTVRCQWAGIGRWAGPARGIEMTLQEVEMTVYGLYPSLTISQISQNDRA